MKIISNKKFKEYMLEIQHLKGEISSKNIEIEYLKKDSDYYENKQLEILNKLYEIENDLRHTVSKKVIKAKVQELITMLGGE